MNGTCASLNYFAQCCQIQFEIASHLLFLRIWWFHKIFLGFHSRHMICSSDGFMNILTLWIYKIECCYLQSNEYANSVSRKICRFVVSKFVKLSGELITGLICSLVVIIKKKYLRNSEFVFWSSQHHLIWFQK